MPARVDDFLFARRRPDYDCFDFANDVWEAETGEDLRGQLGADLRDFMALLATGRTGARRLRRIPRPSSPSIVVMRGRVGDLHVGVYLRGRVLHLKDAGPEYMEVEVASRGFNRVAFYR